MHSGNNISKIDDYRPIPSEGGEYSGGLPPKGGGPYDGDMERRIVKLEDKMDGVQSTLSDIRVTLAEIKASMATRDDIANLKEEIGKRPTRAALGWAFGLLVTLLAGINYGGSIFHMILNR